jgi:hypothetical protein
MQPLLSSPGVSAAPVGELWRHPCGTAGVHAATILATTAITWIIGQPGVKLVGDIDGVESIVYDEAYGWRAWPELRRHLAGRHFDALIHTQASLRANQVSALVKEAARAR